MCGLLQVNNDHACCLATRVADLVKDTATVKPLRTEAMTALCCISRNCVDVFEYVKVLTVLCFILFNSLHIALYAIMIYQDAVVF